MQGLQIVAPIERDVVIGPASGHNECQLVIAGPLISPIVALRDLLDEVDGVGHAIVARFIQCHSDPSVVVALRLSIDASLALNPRNGTTLATSNHRDAQPLNTATKTDGRHESQAHDLI